MLDCTLEDEIPEEFKCGTLALNGDDCSSSFEILSAPNSDENGGKETPDGIDDEGKYQNRWKKNVIVPLSQRKLVALFI